MVRKMIAMVLLAVLALSMGMTALAETQPYEFGITPVSDPEKFTAGAPAVKKKDGDQYFYVTEKERGFTDGRKIYYRSITSSKAKASNFLYFTKAGNTTKKAKYLEDMAIGGNTFYLGLATELKSNDSYAGQYKVVRGQWTP